MGKSGRGRVCEDSVLEQKVSQKQSNKRIKLDRIHQCGILPTLTVYIVKKPYKSLKSSGLQSFFLCYQMCVQIFIL